MAATKKNICIIPARDGSKRIPNKNIRMFCGKELVAWTIESAISTKLFDEIILSTDSPNILKIGQKYGLSTRQLRPLKLSSDTATAEDVIAYHIKSYSDINVCYLQPTSPLRTKNDIVNSYSLLRSKSLDGVISVCKHTTPKNWIFYSDQSFGSFLEKVSSKRSQDYAKGLALNGAIYWCTSKGFNKDQTHFLRENIAPYIMPADRSIDIDEELDFKIAEFLHAQKV